MSEWKQIESAPKDGSYILLAGPSGYMGTPLRVEVGYWQTGDPEYHYLGGWRNYANDWFLDGGTEPTHWMPLPAPPQPTGE